MQRFYTRQGARSTLAALGYGLRAKLGPIGPHVQVRGSDPEAAYNEGQNEISEDERPSHLKPFRTQRAET
jgi:hypothetical protein